MKERNQIEAQLHPSHYHVLHKLPPGDSPYVRAKHVQVLLYMYLPIFIRICPSFFSYSFVFAITKKPLSGVFDQLMSQWTSYRSRRLPIFEEISSFRDQLAC
ncbi:hypothetical protein GOBAR_DD01802 [Gossypium barbadense]|nr:hypothetical protein GOBAR_DD01802 [Gossypium barbadense]